MQIQIFLCQYIQNLDNNCQYIFILFYQYFFKQLNFHFFTIYFIYIYIYLYINTFYINNNYIYIKINKILILLIYLFQLITFQKKQNKVTIIFLQQTNINIQQLFTNVNQRFLDITEIRFCLHLLNQNILLQKYFQIPIFINLLKIKKLIITIGEGAYSIVYKVKRLSDQEEYALKKVKLQNLSDKEKENALNEVRILASIRSNNIVGYKEAFLDPSSNSLCIIMEYLNNGDLYQKISEHQKKGQYFQENEIWNILIQMIKGLKALHDLKIFHRDLK
ncbi:protein kinase domain protein, partial [Ichthyophthirius multifiliis]